LRAVEDRAALTMLGRSDDTQKYPNTRRSLLSLRGGGTNLLTNLWRTGLIRELKSIYYEGQEERFPWVLRARARLSR
jgi:hypothetical protein